MENLTKRQKEVLDAIKAMVAETGSPPTFQEVGDVLGVSGLAAREHVLHLVRKGYVDHDKGVIRSIRVRETGDPILHMSHRERLEQMLDEGLAAAKRRGHYLKVQRSDIAGPLGVTPGLVTYYLGRANEMHNAIVRHAIAVKDIEVLAQGLVSRNTAALGASAELRQKVRGSLK